jgi:hypothetical protein
MDFVYTRVALVDSNSSNLLVRGMDPAVSGTFSSQDIIDAVTALGVDPTGKTLVVVNVIDNVGERWAWAPEVTAFGADPDDTPTTDWPPYVNIPNWDPGTPIGSNTVGDLYWWPFEGLPDNTDPTVFLSSPGWDFAGIVDKVIELFQTSTDSLIYFHCMLGADRTGALHTGYLMKAEGMDLDSASKLADGATSAGSPNADYVRLRAAYAASLAPPIRRVKGPGMKKGLQKRSKKR